MILPPSRFNFCVKAFGSIHFVRSPLAARRCAERNVEHIDAQPPETACTSSRSASVCQLDRGFCLAITKRRHANLQVSFSVRVREAIFFQILMQILARLFSHQIC